MFTLAKPLSFVSQAAQAPGCGFSDFYRSSARVDDVVRQPAHRLIFRRDRDASNGQSPIHLQQHRRLAESFARLQRLVHQCIPTGGNPLESTSPCHPIAECRYRIATPFRPMDSHGRRLLVAVQ